MKCKEINISFSECLQPDVSGRLPLHPVLEGLVEFELILSENDGASSGEARQSVRR